MFPYFVSKLCRSVTFFCIDFLYNIIMLSSFIFILCKINTKISVDHFYGHATHVKFNTNFPTVLCSDMTDKWVTYFLSNRLCFTTLEIWHSTIFVFFICALIYRWRHHSKMLLFFCKFDLNLIFEERHTS